MTNSSKGGMKRIKNITSVVGITPIWVKSKQVLF